MFTLRGCPGTNHAERRPRPILSLPYESDNLKQKSDKKPRNSDTSTTGAGNMDSVDVQNKVGELRQHTDLPIAIGFGIKDAASASSVMGVADGIVAGSVFVDLIGEGDNIIDRVGAKTKELSEVLN